MVENNTPVLKISKYNTLCFHFINPHVYPMSVPHGFHYYSFTVILKSENVNHATFIFLFQDCFGYLGSHVIPFEF